MQTVHLFKTRLLLVNEKFATFSTLKLYNFKNIPPHPNYKSDSPSNIINIVRSRSPFY